MRSISGRLALLFLGVAFGAIAIVYLGVVPRLESTLIHDRAARLREASARLSRPIMNAIDSGAPVTRVDATVREAADAAAARVTLLGVNRGSFGPQPFPKSDSYAGADTGDLDFVAATAAITSGHAETGTESGRTGRVVEAALPLRFRDPETGRDVLGSVVVYTASLRDVERNVAVVRSRILVAAVFALLAALLAGWLVARRLGQRAARLEQAANQVARGDFTARFPLDRDDELGRLGRALDQMQQQLAELDRSRKRFIATASHELRTPIFSIGGFLELLEDEDLDEETRERFLEQIRGQVARLGKLATDLLDLSRLETGAVELQVEDTDLQRLARSVADEFLPALGTHESALALDPGAPAALVHCDPARVAQVLRILLDNAITHTPPGTAIAIAARATGAGAELTVTDHGPGIPRGEIAQVFEPFVTSNGTTGSGLGLAIARELAGLMRGELRVASRPGTTTFTLRLPA
jgi:signal transduction histidine kinase